MKTQAMKKVEVNKKEFICVFCSEYGDSSLSDMKCSLRKGNHLIMESSQRTYTQQEVDEMLKEQKENNIGEFSDGYHTFNELYEHRHLLFSKLAEWKSKLHSDGTMFDGWFIAGIGEEEGKQITYHIPMRLWDIFRCKELDKAPKWDGHTPNDVLNRLSKLN